ncbi:MAG: M67 family metallopeptidase [Deinococcota bacterium]
MAKLLESPLKPPFLPLEEDASVEVIPTRLHLSRRVFDGMLTHAQFVMPQECVGLLFGLGETALTRVPLENTSQDPLRSFYADPERLVQALLEAETRGETLLAIYHSHPDGIARPSIRDLDEANYRVTSIIIAPNDGDIRAYYYQPLGYDDVELLVASS